MASALSILFDRQVEPAAAIAALGALLGGRAPRTVATAAGATCVSDEDWELRCVPTRVPHGLLDDAAAQSGYQDAAALLRDHVAHVRVLPTEAAPDRPPLDRLVRLSRAAHALLALPGALALLDETGRALTSATAARARLDRSSPVPPMELWVSLRSFELADARGVFLDTLGMAQLDLPDLEAYAGDGPAAEQVGAWLRNVALHLAQQDLPLRQGDTLDGPDELPWTVTEDSATVEPARRVLRFAPV